MAKLMRHAAYCGTRNIYGDMETAAKSLVANSSVDVVHMIIEDHDMGRELPPIVKCHDVSGQTWFAKDGPNMTSQYTYMAMVRIALCHVLPRVRKVLSLDHDTICARNIDDIWEIPLDGMYLSASHEWHRTTKDAIYCNFGVVLYNLEALRDGKADECIAELNANRYPWVEQDVGNYRCQGHIRDMPSEYNSNWWTDKNAPNARILHYAGLARMDWASRPEVEKYRAMSWDMALWMHERHKARSGH
jgi:lipopolysaccharide biosynthesis glycosyltransferase